jgi:hypothetical protein
MAIQTEHDAEMFLKSVHGFHDGFIQRITITSADTFDTHDQGVAHVLTGQLNAEIEFARHPVPTDPPGVLATVRCRFRDVTDVYLDLRQVQGIRWPLYAVSFKASQPRRLSLHCKWGNGDAEAQCLFAFAELEVMQE